MVRFSSCKANICSYTEGVAIVDVDEPLATSFFVISSGRIEPRAFKRHSSAERVDVERVISSFPVERGEGLVWRFALEMRSGDLWEVAYDGKRSRVVLLRVDSGP